MKIALEDFLAVFDALKVQVEPYSKWIRHPELFPNGLSDILQYSTDKKRAALGDFYRCQASPMEVEQEYYFLYADHGSDYHGMYQQWMANLLTPLRDRRRICAQVIENYNEALATGTITDPDAPQPNMEVLQACYEASAQSIQNGANGYTMLSLDLNRCQKHKPAAPCVHSAQGALLWLHLYKGFGRGRHRCRRSTYRFC